VVLQQQTIEQNEIINEIFQIAKEQAEAIKTINSSIQQLYASINILVDEAKNLTDN